MSESRPVGNGSPVAEAGTTSKSLVITIPDPEGPAQSKNTDIQDGNSAKNQTLDNLYEEGASFAGLKLKSIREEANEGSPTTVNGAEGKQPDIDVVHVVGALSSQQAILDLDDLLPQASEKREMHFFVNIDILLNNDAEFTEESVVAEAHRLLSGLEHFQHSDAELSRKAIIFVAYDIGAIILQKAISVASLQHPGEPGIFTDTARVIFCGCFLREESEVKMGLKLFKFLEREKQWEEKTTPLTLSAAQNLASSWKEAKLLFLRSKVALRTRVISLYAGTGGSQIPAEFDYYTGTLGIASELAIEELHEDGDHSIRFPQLAVNLSASIQGWAPKRWQAALESTLMALIPQDTQMLSKCQSKDHPVFSSAPYQTWLSQAGTQILYIDGPDVQTNTVCAEQIGLAWVRKRISSTGNVFSFRFDSRDFLRKSIGPMLTAAFLHFFLKGSSENVKTWPASFRDQHKLQNAWLEEDILKLTLLLYTWVSEDTPLLLLDLDQCDLRSRETLWALLGYIANQSEEPVKLVVTSSSPGGTEWYDVLKGELKQWPEIHLSKYASSHDEDSKTMDYPGEDVDKYHARLISRLCPKGLSASEVRENLTRLSSMDRGTLDSILHLLETFSRWPAIGSSANFAHFRSLLQNVTRTSTPRSILDSIVQCIPDQGWLRWLLKWTLCGQRPLTFSEISMLLCYCTEPSAVMDAVVDTHLLQQSAINIENQLRGIVTCNVLEDTVDISPIVLQIWEEDEGSLWTEVKQTAAEMTGNFLLDYLGSKVVQNQLDGLYGHYKAVADRSQDDLTSPLRPDGKNAIFYAVQALPYHLSRITISEKVREHMCNPQGPYSAWSKVYWAMSNPFSRPAQGPLTSAWLTWETSPESGTFGFARPHHVGGSENEVEDSTALIQNLTAAVKVGDEDSSMIFAEQVLARLGEDEKALYNSETLREEEPRYFPWPSSIIWRATWLGMNRLLELLLRNGLRHEDDFHDTLSEPGRSPSLVYMASGIGNSGAVQMLLRKGANFKGTRNNPYSALYVAVGRGELETIEALVKMELSMLEEPQHTRPLYTAAAFGCWKAVELLVKFGAHPNAFSMQTPVHASEDDDAEATATADFFTPLTAACSTGFTNTARVLLENGANPNMPALSNRLMPLYFAAVLENAKVEMVQLLLEHGASPNHALLEPPILSAIVNWAEFTDEDKVNTFNLLLENDPPVVVDKADKGGGQTALMAAARKEDMAALRWLLDHGASVNAVDSENRHALYWAVHQRKARAVEQLLRHHEKPLLELRTSDNDTLLERAVGDLGILQMLLDAGVDLTYENVSKQTVLNVAVTEGDTETVSLLLSLGSDKQVDIHHQDWAQWTPIMDATGNPTNVEMVKVLMDHGARLSDVTPGGTSPLHFAAGQVRPDILRVLLEYHTAVDVARRDNDGDTPLMRISTDSTFEENATLDCTKLLLRAGSDINAQDQNGSTFLMKSGVLGPDAREVYDYLLGRPDINVRLATEWGVTALHKAAEFGVVSLVTGLLAHGAAADINTRANANRSTPLLAACIPHHIRRTDIADMLADRERIVRCLVQHGANVDAMEGWSLFSPLCAASLYAGVGTVNFLLDESASVQRADPMGRLPIHFAAANGLRNFEAVAFAHSGDIMVSDRFGKNILHWAAEFGHVNTVRAIFERLVPEDRKRYANGPDADGWAPLAWASRPTTTDVGSYWCLSENPDYKATIECLLEHGADKSVRFHMGHDEEKLIEVFTPLKMAKRCGLEDDVVRLLEIENTESIDNPNASLDEHESTGLADRKKYMRPEANCDFCFSEIWGIFWRCLSCQRGEYILCKKCYGRIHVEHQRTAADDKEGADHHFELQARDSQEFEAENVPTAVPSSNAASIAGSVADVEASRRQDSPMSEQEEHGVDFTPGGDDEDFDIGQLDFSEFTN